ncbi:Protein of unknown function [Gryllus bimaculatus]|nr:Protein of unknown function [Gryllus bimaculatus]
MKTETVNVFEMLLHFILMNEGNEKYKYRKCFSMIIMYIIVSENNAKLEIIYSSENKKSYFMTLKPSGIDLLFIIRNIKVNVCKYFA